MTRKFGSASIPAGAPPSGFNLVQLGSVALGAPGSDLVDIAGGINAQRQIAEAYVFNTVTANWERLRTASILKNANIFAAGASTIWTPAAGKKFRLMAYRIMVTGNVAIAAAAVLNVGLLDGGANMGTNDDIFVPNAAGTGPMLYTGAWVILPGNGYLSAAANNVLAGNLGVATTSGGVRIDVAGTEE